MSLDDVLNELEARQAPGLADLDARISALAKEREKLVAQRAKVRLVAEVLRGVRALICLTPAEQKDLSARRYSPSLIRKGLMSRSHRVHTVRGGRADEEYLTEKGYAARGVLCGGRPPPEGLAALADGILLEGAGGPPLERVREKMVAEGLSVPVPPADAAKVLRILAGHLPTSGDRSDAQSLLALFERAT